MRSGAIPENASPAEMVRGTPHEENVFLEGPKSRRFELARALRIFAEFMRGFRALHFVGPCVTVFGSARFGESHRYYDLARDVGRILARLGFTVMTGGGPGIMEAASRGAKDAGGRTIGCNIQLPVEQQPNAFLDRFVIFDYFFVRKVMLMKYSYAFIALPGGFGTMDEIFEAATLVQTGKIREFPIVLVGSDYWRPTWEAMSQRMLFEGAIGAADLRYVRITDSLDEITEIIERCAIQKFGLEYVERIRPRCLLAEHGARFRSTIHPADRQAAR